MMDVTSLAVLMVSQQPTSVTIISLFLIDFALYAFNSVCKSIVNWYTFPGSNNEVLILHTL